MGTEYGSWRQSKVCLCSAYARLRARPSAGKPLKCEDALDTRRLAPSLLNSNWTCCFTEQWRYPAEANATS